MKISLLFLCGVFAEENQQEVIRSAVGPVEYSANIFQEKMISGFRKSGVNLEILSAPFIGAYPTRSKRIYFKKFENTSGDYEYVSFNNIWGYRNFSRAHSLKRSIRTFANRKTEDKKIIVVYSAHEPFLEAAVYAKKIDPAIKICYVVPDLPQYMNLDANRSIIYDLFKKIDINCMDRYASYVDSFMVLTEQMKDVLKVGNRPSIVVEGIIDDFPQESVTVVKDSMNEKFIVYTGKLNEKFGVKDLVDAFVSTNNEEYRLVLCGNGDCDSYIRDMATKDHRIMYVGQVLPEEAREWQKKAHVLINPRPNNEEYTKYSFPSKNIEYLMTGNPVVAYMLDGMGQEYRKFIYPIEGSIKDISETIEKAMNDSESSKQNRYNAFMTYAGEKLCAVNIAERIIDLCN